jgi:hypothetical protein
LLNQEIFGFADIHSANINPEWARDVIRVGKKMTSKLTSPQGRGIIQVAGELDDRWSGLRKRAGREESPDTTLRKQSISIGRKAAG